jgi:hypothetical protein
MMASGWRLVAMEKDQQQAVHEMEQTKREQTVWLVKIGLWKHAIAMEAGQSKLGRK